ncbi:alpha/beta hydrolase [Blautia sp. HCP3S3_H10_1]|uniref:alpha/beta hydrolase n=1 Tax=unclassified Blautia TaxID=2648079 RepID=UPI003F8E128D
MYNLFPDKEVNCNRIQIPRRDGKNMPALLVSPKKKTLNAPGILWIHGGGYVTGMKEMVHMSRAVDLVKKYGATVLSPGYRLSFVKPYPAAVEDCYDALLYLKNHAGKFDINKNQLMVGGESAGGGLCAALCMIARDKGEVQVAYQMPLYPMLDNLDTKTSANNHGKVWNTRRNHIAWRLYLRKNAKKVVSPYAAPARQMDYTNLPPAYTFVGNGEPFYSETCTYIENLQKAGIDAQMDVYESDMHAFDMLKPELQVSKEAAAKFNLHFEHALKHYFAEN